MNEFNQEQLRDFIERGRKAQEAVDAIIERPSFTCPECSMTSYNPNDIEQGYCGNCHAWTGKGY